MRECPREPTPDQIQQAVQAKRTERNTRVFTDFKRAAYDRSAPRAGKPTRVMNQAMAFFVQLEAQAREDVKEAADGDGQLFAALQHDQIMDLQHTLRELESAVAEASKVEPEDL